MKERINEHDMTKKMMDVIRGGFKQIIKEEAEDQQDTVEYGPGNSVYQEELKKIKDIVDSSIEIDNFNAYVNPENKNVVMTGTMLFGKLAFRFELIKDEAELSTVEPYDLTAENNAKINKMTGYFQKWRDEWAIKINDEIKQKSM